MVERVPADFVLEGIYYSAEQAGLLQRDAVSLLDQGRYASACVLGTYCYEEVGRAQILLESWKEVGAAGEIELARIEKLLGDHEAKLARGQLVTVFGIGPEQAKRMKPDDRSGETERILNEMAQAKRKRNADDIIERRQTCLYTDIIRDGSLSWNRPATISAEEARFFVHNKVVNNYAVLYFELQNDRSPVSKPFRRAFPPLPEPCFPK
jgi:AbiV family abortive infection protein